MSQTIQRQCKDCQQPFEISPEEQNFFESKNLELPKRCIPCRRKRRGATLGDVQIRK